ncbi:uncharacterized protein LOC142161697 [Nicotiana tabacum]|uniref:Uncharacterized protein LOC142161697 n=1 Tax=Nicotiana tabacum TaxID=4097 RepID=A0AC58RPD3_TOBAC
MKRYFTPVSSKLPQSSSSRQNAPPGEENLNQLEEQPPSSKKQRQRVDLDSLKADPKEKISIRDYHPNELDEIRRAYLQRGPYQPGNHKFPKRDFSGLKHRFNPKWFDQYHDWLEYSVIEDAAYCLCCYLFQDESIHQVGESCDISRKEQMAIVLRYVDRMGSVVERFIGIVHVRDTSDLCLKEAIVNYIVQCSLSLSYVRGQCYDGASNIQRDLSGLKTLIQKEVDQLILFIVLLINFN